MKKRMILLLTLAMTIFSANGAQKVIYGEDNRRDIKDVTDSQFLKLAVSTAAMISHSSITVDGENATISAGTLGSRRNLCADEPFRDQLAAANCSGFLIAPDVLVTAGHCVRSSFSCDSYAWVFDFAVTGEKDEKSVPSSSVYRCKEIISQVLDRSTKDDYAVLRLDRAVTDRDPLKFRKEGKIEDFTQIVVIGHPSGLPTKVADGAYVRSNTNQYFFQANLDTYGGNSGSAVFNVATGEVEGILVRGETDYVSRGGCTASNHCSDEGCRGEDVTRITNIPELKNY